MWGAVRGYTHTLKLVLQLPFRKRNIKYLHLQVIFSITDIFLCAVLMLSLLLCYIFQRYQPKAFLMKILDFGQSRYVHFFFVLELWFTFFRVLNWQCHLLAAGPSWPQQNGCKLGVTMKLLIKLLIHIRASVCHLCHRIYHDDSFGPRFVLISINTLNRCTIIWLSGCLTFSTWLRFTAKCPPGADRVTNHF